MAGSPEESARARCDDGLVGEVPHNARGELADFDEMGRRREPAEGRRMRGRNYVADKAWSDQYLGKILAKLGPFLAGPTSFRVDCVANSDIKLLVDANHAIAARVRSEGYGEKYPWDVTIRVRRDSGATTELAKIMAGLGDWMFYGHVDKRDELARWFLVDLDVFRADMRKDATRYRGINDLHTVGDGSHFGTIDVRELPAGGVIGASHEVVPFERAGEFLARMRILHAKAWRRMAEAEKPTGSVREDLGRARPMREV